MDYAVFHHWVTENPYGILGREEVRFETSTARLAAGFVVLRRGRTRPRGETRSAGRGVARRPRRIRSGQPRTLARRCPAARGPRALALRRVLAAVPEAARRTPEDVRDFSLPVLRAACSAEQLRTDWLQGARARAGAGSSSRRSTRLLSADDPEVTCYALLARWKRDDAAVRRAVQDLLERAARASRWLPAAWRGALARSGPDRLEPRPGRGFARSSTPGLMGAARRSHGVRAARRKRSTRSGSPRSSARRSKLLRSPPGDLDQGRRSGARHRRDDARVGHAIRCPWRSCGAAA